MSEHEVLWGYNVMKEKKLKKMYDKVKKNRGL